VKNLGGYQVEILRYAQNDKNSLLIADLYKNISVGRASVPASERRPGTAAPPTPAIFHLLLCPQGNDRWNKNLQTAGIYGRRSIARINQVVRPR
jgi:hypothetical protein